MQGFLAYIQLNKNKVPSTASVFLKNSEALYKPGEIWKQPDLANTLMRIHKDGPDGFYKGKTTRLILDFMKENGGIITQQDLEEYKAEELEPIHATYRGYDINLFQQVKAIYRIVLIKDQFFLWNPAAVASVKNTPSGSYEKICTPPLLHFFDPGRGRAPVGFYALA